MGFDRIEEILACELQTIGRCITEALRGTKH
jgi:hypothetical protein